MERGYGFAVPSLECQLNRWNWTEVDSAFPPAKWLSIARIVISCASGNISGNGPRIPRLEVITAGLSQCVIMVVGVHIYPFLTSN